MLKYSDCPLILRDFLTYHETIKGQSQLTISEYALDLRMFLRFMKLMRNEMPMNTDLETINIKDIDIEFIRNITTSGIRFSFLPLQRPTAAPGLPCRRPWCRPQYPCQKALCHQILLQIFDCEDKAAG